MTIIIYIPWTRLLSDPTVATAVGALVLARAVDDPKLSDALRQAALHHLTPAG